MKRNGSLRGFTLIDLVIAMLIAAILTTIAVPSYQQYLRRANRSVLKTFLAEVVKRQEEQSLKTRCYAASFGPLLGAEQTSVAINRKGALVASSDSTAIYLITLSETEPVACPAEFTLEATPLGNQVKDTDCTKFSIRASGARKANDSTDKAQMQTCWGR